MTPRTLRIGGWGGLLLVALIGLGSTGWAVERLTSPLQGAIPVRVNGEGRVVEAIATGGYVYLRLDTLPGGSWLVISGVAPPLGVKAAYKGFAELRGFRSRSLARSFPRIIFSSITHNKETHHESN